MHHETIPISRLIYRIIDLTTVAAHRYAFLWHLPFFCAFSCCQCILSSAIICDSQTAKLIFCQLGQKNHLLIIQKMPVFQKFLFLKTLFHVSNVTLLRSENCQVGLDSSWQFQVSRSPFFSELGAFSPKYGAYMNHIILEDANL